MCRRKYITADSAIDWSDERVCYIQLELLDNLIFTAAETNNNSDDKKVGASLITH